MVQPRKEQLNILRAYWTKYTYTATAGTTSTALPGGFQSATVTQTAGGNPSTPTRGIITTGSGGFVRIRKQADGQSLDDGAAQVFGRLTHSSGTYTVTYKKLSGGSEVSATLPGVGTYSVDILFPEVMTEGEVPGDAFTILGANGELNPLSGAAGTFTDLTVTGNTILGDAISDTITTTARWASDIIASADGLRSIGSSSRRWANIHSTEFTARADSSDSVKAILESDSLLAEGTSFDIDGSDALFIGTSSATSIDIGQANVPLNISGDITINNNSSLETSGSGNINLPNNASARFKIENVSVDANVTAANLTALVNESNADHLHTHTFSVDVVTFSGLSGEILYDGELVCADGYDGYNGEPAIFKAYADAGSPRGNVVGVVDGYTLPGSTVSVLVCGEKEIPDDEWDSVPTEEDIGKIVYLSLAAGNWTLDPPDGYGRKCGVLTQGGSGNSFVTLQLGGGDLYVAGAGMADAPVGTFNIGAGSYIIVNNDNVEVDATTTATANKVMARDSSGHAYAASFRDAGTMVLSDTSSTMGAGTTVTAFYTQTTANATPIAITGATHTIADGTAVRMTISAIAVKESDDEAAMFDLRGGAVKIAATTAVELGTYPIEDPDPLTSPGATAWNLQIIRSGADLVPTLTGGAYDVHWKIWIEKSITPN